MSADAPISRFPVPKLAEMPEDIRARIARCRRRPASCPNVFLALRAPAGRVPRLHRLSRRADGQGRRPHQGRARDDRGRDQRRQRLPLLRRRPRRDPAGPRQEPADRRPGRGQLPQGRHHAAAAGDARLRGQGRAARPHDVDDADFAALRAHGFADDDIWDIAAIAAFFAMSNRLAQRRSHAAQRRVLRYGLAMRANPSPAGGRAGWAVPARQTAPPARSQRSGRWPSASHSHRTEAAT